MLCLLIRTMISLAMDTSDANILTSANKPDASVPLSECLDVPVKGLVGEDFDCPTGSVLLNKFVVVSYDNRPYPGRVIDYDEQDIKVSCMHKLGPYFFWPRLRQDICWYNYSDLLAVIEEPTLVKDRHYEVHKFLWDRIVSKLLSK